MNEPLAIVGMACRLPGADGLDAFWQLVVERGTAWGVLPESRLPRDLYFHPEKGRLGKSYSKMGAVVSDRPVNRSVCPLTDDMLDRYDVAHQIFLEVASLACRDAGLDPFAMPAARRTGVYVGHTGGSTRIGDIVYSTGIDEAAALLGEVEAARAVLGDAVDEVAAQLTHEVRRRYPGRQPGQQLDLGAIGAAQIVREALRLDGPFLVVDAACASSLQALAIASRALLQGSIDQAIVGGASYCKSDSLVLFSAAQSVSNSGSCPFGEAADGLVTAEGYVALVIKTLSRAVADGDRIRGVIRGLGVASDGKGKSLWAPREEGQVLAVQRAYPDPADLGRIEYIEAHATSTEVGDATELSALARLLRPHVPAGRTIPIGSVKANIGHTLETAGLAGLVKVVLAMEHNAIPPGSTCQELTSEFDWQDGPFRVPRDPVAWPPHADGSPRLAAVNAFGIGGLNVHVALGEHMPSAAPRPSSWPTGQVAANDQRIAIVGAGCVLPGSLSLDAFLARIDRGESAIGPVPADRWLAARALDRSGPRTWHSMGDRGGFVRDFAYDWRRHKVPPKQIAAANPLQFMLLEAADAALLDAGTPAGGLDRTRTGVVVGTLFGGDFANQLQMGLRLPETGRDLRDALARRGVGAAEIDRIVEAYEKKVLEKMPALIDETGSFTSSTLASRLTKTFDLMGGALALDAGDCSSVAAISAAADMLRDGTCDAVLCAAGQRSLDLMTFEGLSLLSRLEPASAAKPGSVVPGEGAVVFVLKRFADAVAAGNRIRGVVRTAQVRAVAETSEPAPPSLAGLIGHTGAAAGAAELLALLHRGESGTIAISGGGQAGRIDVGDSSIAPPTPARAIPTSVASPAPEPAASIGRPLVAALFPGQGSQYADMFRGLVAESAEARAAVTRLDALARSLGHETLAEIAWRADNGLGTRVWDTQWAMYLGDLFAWDVLRGMGFAPDIVASHSFGEFPALAAANAWSVEDGARAARARADAVEAHGPHDGAMLSVIANELAVHAAIGLVAGRVWVCAENAPEQFVIGGTARVVDAVEVLLESRRVKSKRLAVPSPFHTPLLQRAADHLATAIESFAITPPSIPILSSTTVSRMVEPAAVRESLIRQMTQTVRWIGVVEHLYATGVRTFVEVGPSGVLTGLTRRILEGRAGCTFLQFDQRGRAAGEYLARLREQLGQAGAIRANASAASPHRSASQATKHTSQPTRGTVISFDATARRRERNRTAHDGSSRVTGNGHAEIHTENNAHAHANGDQPHDSGNEIETFLVDFVVEQTGYPREIVELDADLEADLGIDSIRKAQLFGEIGQRYSLKADESLSLDEFPTLRHLLAYMLPRVGVAAAASPTSAPQPAPPRATSPPAARPALLDGFDAVLVAPRDGTAARGVIACFGRHAVPDVRRAVTNGMASTCISAAGSPGAVAGWNESGLIALARRSGGAAVPATAAIEEVITTCRSLDDATRFIATLPSAPRGIAVVHVAGGGFHVAPHGGVEPLVDPLLASDPRSPLGRIALADGTVAPEAALAALLDRRDSAARDALSAACAWWACGVAGAPVAVSGGPVAGTWLTADAAMSGAAWRAGSRGMQSLLPGSESNGAAVTRRYGLSLRGLGPAQRSRSLARERVLIIGPAATAEALASAVAAEGGAPIVADCESAQAAIAAVERAEESGAVRHLIVAAGGRGGAWSAHRTAGIVAPFFACQRWITLRAAAGDIASSTLTAAVALGGGFGLSGTVHAVEGGAIAGLFKGIAREFPGLHVRVVDAAAGTSSPAAAVVAEMLDGVGPVEIGLVHGKRVGVVAEEREPVAGTPLESLRRGSVWIVTGGARGVTAECARELGRRHGLVLALVGSTEPVSIDPAWLALDEAGLKELKGRVMLDARGRGADPRSAWRTIEKSIEIEKSRGKFRAAGVDARYFACDLADESAVRAFAQRVVRELGPVRGILHGAGFESACRFDKKTLEGLEATLGPKCVGLEHLLAAVDPSSLEAVVGFGSTSGRLGGHGQADYSLANDLLAKIIGARRQRGLRATVFHWHAWDEVGMASRPESRFVLEQFGLTFMPLAEGVRRFMDELEAGLPEAEVLVTEPACVPDAVGTEAPAATGPRGSLVEGIVTRASSANVTFRLDPSTDRFLLDHLQFGRPLLPAVMGAELLAQAAIATGMCGEVQEIRDFTVERPLAFPTNQPRQVRVEVAAAGAGAVEAVGWAADGQPAAEPRITIRGIVSTAAAAPIVETTSQPPLPFNPMVYADDAPLWHGASFRTLTGLFLDRSGGWGRLVAPADDIVAAPRGAGGWTVPAALLDGCIVACAVYSYILCGLRVEVPVKMERLRITCRPRTGEICTARLLFCSHDVRESIYDLTLFGDDGRAILAVNGLHLAVMRAEREHA